MKKIKKGIKILIISLSIILVAVLTLFLLYKTNKKELKIIDEIEVNEDVKLKELLGNDIELIGNYEIDTTKLGEQEIKVRYKNKIFTYTDTIKITITDTEAPTIEVKDLKIEKGTQIDITKDFQCIDNYDKNPNCYVEGTYNINEEGIYLLKYIGEDSSKNKAEKNFTLTVYETKQKIYEPKQETIVCEQTQSTMDVDLNAVVKVNLENNNFKGINMKIDVVLPEKFINQKQTFIKSFERQYASFETNYGVKPVISETDKGLNVKVDMTAEQAKEFSESEDLGTSREEIIESFTSEGYICK